jgi:hypothetical protein
MGHSSLNMELRWLIEVSVMGLLLTVTTSQKYPQPKSTSYPNERAPLANRYNSDRPTMTTDDDYLPVAAIEPGYGTNSPGGNYNQYPNPAGGSDNDSTKYPAKDYHVPLSYCPEVGGLESHCRPAKDCAVWYNIVRTIPGTSCTLEKRTRRPRNMLSQHALQWFNAASRLYD